MNQQIANDEKYHSNHRPNESPRARRRPQKQPVNESRFVTVSIPDLNVQQFAASPRNGVAVEKHFRAEQTEARPESEKSVLSSGNATPATESTRRTKTTQAAERADNHFSQRPTGSTESNSFLAEAAENHAQIQPLVDSIVDCYHIGETALVMFAGSENNPHLDITVARAASATQIKTGGRILIIDSDFENGGLTYRMECVGRTGLSDLLKNEKNCKHTARSTNCDKLDFMPIGRVQFETPEKIEKALPKALPHFVDGYDYVFVNVGDAHGRSAASWSNYASASYLVVSMKHSNRLVAKSAVSSLNSQGARLLGCIVSDIDE